MDIRKRNNVHVSGQGDRAMVFAHGSAATRTCGGSWRPSSRDEFKVVLFDHVGAGGSDLSAYDKTKYSTLHGYADDLVEIGRASRAEGRRVRRPFGQRHDRAAGLAEGARPVREMVLVGPSPRYIDDGDYVGGFSEKQIAELLEFLEDNHMGWSAAMAPSIMGNPDRPELGEELTNSFCRTDPEIAKAFARVTFTSDNRERPRQGHGSDPDSPMQRGHHRLRGGREVRQKPIPGSEIVFLKATGHCPNLSAPAEVVSAIRAYV